MDPVELNEPVPGSYSSADAKAPEPSAEPPVIRTLPFASKIAVCDARAIDIDPVGLNKPVVGSYSSADTREGLPPPVIRTLPFASKVAVWYIRTLDMDPVGVNRP
jgi:hypothetical protein